jgi:hypothetical protein
MSTLQRVTRTDPCIICQKDSWCLFGKDVAICMRVVSQRSKTFTDGSIGYLHGRDGQAVQYNPPKRKEQPFVDSAKIAQQWADHYGTESLTYLAKNLGICKAPLELLRCVKAPQPCVWGFPMREGKGHIIGIRMRHENGRKWCNPGGHNGLFIPNCNPQKEVVICEGPTDTAAALHICLYAIGRFNCAGGVDMIKEFIKLNNIRRATIVADVDNDRVIDGSIVNPGIQGAMALGELIGIPSRCVTLPAKDMREFVTLGGDQATFKSIADQVVWNK